MWVLFSLVVSVSAFTSNAFSANTENKCDQTLVASPRTPLTVSHGNGHLSAIYHSKVYDLQLNDGRVFKFSRNGKILRITETGSQPEIFNCVVERNGHSWGNSQMRFSCRKQRGRAQMYMALVSRAQSDHVAGYLIIAPTELQVQVQLNWMVSGFIRETNPEIVTYTFKSLYHSGWIRR